MASVVRCVLALASLFVVLSIAFSAPASDVTVDGLEAGTTSSNGGGGAATWQNSQSGASSNNGAVSSDSNTGTYAGGAVITETITLTENCEGCETTLTDSYLIGYQDAANGGSASATASGQGAQAGSNTGGNSQSNTSGGSGASGVMDSSSNSG